MSSFLEFLGILFIFILIALLLGWMYFITDSLDKLQGQVNNNAKIDNNNHDKIDYRLEKLEKRVKKKRRKSND